jgi:hypothetical protein
MLTVRAVGLASILDSEDVFVKRSDVAAQLEELVAEYNNGIPCPTCQAPACH